MEKILLIGLALLFWSSPCLAAQETILGGSGVLWGDEKVKINSNFTQIWGWLWTTWAPTGTIDLSSATVTFGLDAADIPDLSETYQTALTFGIANTNAVLVDDADAASGQILQFTATGVEGVTTLSGIGVSGGTASTIATWDGSGNLVSNTALGDLNANGTIANHLESIVWNSAGTSSDGTQCASPTEVTINSGPITYTTICADNDASTIYGHVVMPDGWDGGTVTMESEYLQTAADTNALNGDIACMCRGAGETINNTWGTEVAIDDAAVSGSNIVDHTTSVAMTCNGTCAAGDTLFWRYQVDATGTTTAMATLHFIGWKMEYTTDGSD